MAISSGTPKISIDRTKTLSQEAHLGHNRWHPDITPVIEVEQGQVIGIETRDAPKS